MRQSYMKLNFDCFEDMIEKYNPFAFKDAKGEAMLFSDYGKVYEYLFKTIAEECPAGYIDIPLFMNKRTGMPLLDCKRFVNTWWKKDEVVHLDWTFFPDVRAFLIELVTMFHKISETAVDHEKLQMRLAVFLGEIKVKLENAGAEVIM